HCRLTYRDETGKQREETWEAWNPWPAVVEAFEAATTAQPRPSPLTPRPSPLTPYPSPLVPHPSPLAWNAEIRCLALHDAARPRPGTEETRCRELEDAARRSIERRRASSLDYQEATEEASFKGTMTLVGCGLIWASLVMLILSFWHPWLAWLIAPLFGVFLVMQILRWIVPASPRTTVPRNDLVTDKPAV